MTVRLHFNVREHATPPVLVIELSGTIDSSKSLEKVHDLISRSPLDKILVLMPTVDYINSAGFAEIVVLDEKASQGGKVLMFADLNDKVGSVFNHLGGQHILKLQPSEPEALEALAG